MANKCKNTDTKIKVDWPINAKTQIQKLQFFMPIFTQKLTLHFSMKISWFSIIMLQFYLSVFLISFSGFITSPSFHLFCPLFTSSVNYYCFKPQVLVWAFWYPYSFPVSLFFWHHHHFYKFLQINILIIFYS